MLAPLTLNVKGLVCYGAEPGNGQQANARSFTLPEFGYDGLYRKPQSNKAMHRPRFSYSIHRPSLLCTNPITFGIGQ